jgi:ribonuclease P protein component
MAPQDGDREGDGKASRSFPKSLRLRRRTEFLRVQSQGRRVHTPHFLLILLPRPDGGQKLGITVTKKVGTAVQRNRVRRLVREVFRHHRGSFPEGCELVVIAKRGAPELGYADVRSEILHVEHAMRSALVRARREAMSP